MRFLSALLTMLFVASMLALGVVILVLAEEPVLERVAEFSPQQVERARQVFQRHDPRRAAGGPVRTLQLSEDELDLALNYLVSRFGPGGSRATLDDDGLAVVASIALPPNPFGKFVNVEGRLRERDGALVPESVSIGRIPLPDWLAAWLFDQAQAYLGRREDFRVIADTVRAVTLSPTDLKVEYAWTEDFPERLRSAAFSQDDRARLKAYQLRMAELVRGTTSPRTIPVLDVLVPLMRLAAERSANGGADLENRALLTVLALHAGGRDLATFVPEAKQWARPARKQLTLAGRVDLAQHFIISAALAGLGGGAFADAIGVHKEVGDARKGSGFSFKDFAANRAGAAFGRLAADPGTAASLQQRVITGLVETDMLPAMGDLPEFMRLAEFNRRYGGVGAPAYVRIVQDIDQRIAALPLFR